MQIFQNRVEEVNFWQSFGYSDDEVIYCTHAKDSTGNTDQGNEDHE